LGVGSWESEVAAERSLSVTGGSSIFHPGKPQMPTLENN